MSGPSVAVPPGAQVITVGLGELGISIFATRPIPEGELITNLDGPLISFDQAVAKGHQESYALQIGKEAYLDLRSPGCFVNHSCEPNSGVRDAVTLVAIRPIAAGEEIRYDYSTTMDEDYWVMSCRCGAAHCRGTIGDFKHLPHDLQASYLSRGLVQPFIAAQYLSQPPENVRRLNGALRGHTVPLHSQRGPRVGHRYLARRD